ncbi:hypothetical protein BDQ17DRAFT_1414081 [Cyathus striatus]|nr:hypothetical protein BDQ17DRAFT_1414081 [Cyathus striatus]
MLSDALSTTCPLLVAVSLAQDWVDSAAVVSWCLIWQRGGVQHSNHNHNGENDRNTNLSNVLLDPYLSSSLSLDDDYARLKAVGGESAASQPFIACKRDAVNLELDAAGSRVYVQESIYEKLIDILIAKVKQQVILATVSMRRAAEVRWYQRGNDRVWGHIEAGKQEGAKVILGGVQQSEKGYYVDPTNLFNFLSTIAGTQTGELRVGKIAIELSWAIFNVAWRTIN